MAFVHIIGFGYTDVSTGRKNTFACFAKNFFAGKTPAPSAFGQVVRFDEQEEHLHFRSRHMLRRLTSSKWVTAA